MVKKILGPKSKYDKTIPFTYMAKVPVIEGDDELANYYFADTICGLIEYLDEHKIEPAEAELFGCYLKKEIPLDNHPLLTEDGKWLQRPELCRKLEDHYQETMDERYKGHEAHSDCSFDDRDREAF